MEKGGDKSEYSFVNDRGIKIFCKYWGNKEEPKPRALLFLCHGLAEHCLYYEEIARNMTEKQFYVFAHDHQGHGQSEGSRSAIKDLRHYVADVFKHIDTVKEQFPGLPVFILGHSMGGCISILAGLDRPDYFKGVILIGPPVTPDPEAVSRVRIFLGKLLARIFPQCPVLWLKSEDISHDKTVCDAYDKDPLVDHGGMKACTGLSILNALIEIEPKLSSIQWPFLVIHGAQDKIVPPNGSKALYAQASSSDKTMMIMENCYHQPHGELEPLKSETLNGVVQWLEKHVA